MPSSQHPRGHRVAYSDGRRSPSSGITRTVARCQCGKRIAGWDHMAVIRRVVKHHDEVRAEELLEQTIREHL